MNCYSLAALERRMKIQVEIGNYFADKNRRTNKLEMHAQFGYFVGVKHLKADFWQSRLTTKPKRHGTQRNWSSSEAIWLLPSQIRTCGFPAYGSSRR